MTAPDTPAPGIEILSSRHFGSWLAASRVSLAFTTYQAGKLFFIGLLPDGQLSVFERTFNRCMGLHAAGNALYMSTLYQLWRLENSLDPGQVHEGYDRLYIPQLAYTTGDLDIHDLAVEADGRIVFVNTLFGCLATVSERASFVPLWKPPFLSRLAAEDRCHVNGLALRDGRCRYVTTVSQTDVNDGWRDRRRDGGTVIDLDNDGIVATGLSMPHSPRWYADRLWMLDSGNGNFGHVDLATGRFEPVSFCPGYLRGLCFAGEYAIAGLSRPRANKTFEGLALEDQLRQRGAEARCGLQVISLKSGDVVHWLRIEGVVEELYDVVALPGARRPMALGFMTDEIRRTVTVGSADGALRPASGSATGAARATTVAPPAAGNGPAASPRAATAAQSPRRSDRKTR